MAKKKTLTQECRYWLAQEWRWFRNHGACLEAYIERYGKGTDPDKFGSGGELIFEADWNKLNRLYADAGKHCHPRKRCPRRMPRQRKAT